MMNQANPNNVHPETGSGENRLAQQEMESPIFLPRLQQGMAHLLAERLKILDGIRIRCDHSQDLTAAQDSQRLLGFENGERAIQPGGVEFSIDSDHGGDDSGQVQGAH